MVYEVTRSILFYLDTRQRSGGTIGAPVFTFPNNLLNIQPQTGERVRLTMQEASLEYTFFQTEDFNNRMMVTETVNDGTAVNPNCITQNRLITIENGNYNLTTFVVEITQKLNEGSWFVWTVTYIPETNRLSFIADLRPSLGYILPPCGAITFNFNRQQILDTLFVDVEESMNEIMGFDENAVVPLNGPNQNELFTLTSAIPITMSPGVENLYVTIRNTCSNYGNANERNVFTSSNILAKIPISNPPFSTIFFFDINSNFSTIIENKYLDNLDLALYNERFTVIQPRKDWTMTIKIEVLQEKTESKTTTLLAELLQLTKLKFMRKNNTKNDTKNNNS
jgi:hypothetical protein